MLEKQRANGLVRERIRAEELSQQLPAIIESQVGAQIQKLEDKLVTEFKDLGQRAVEQSTTMLSDQLGSRIDTLEKVSEMQSRTLMDLRDSSKQAHDKVGQVVDSIESSLAEVVPGFKLSPMSQKPQLPSYAHPQFVIEEPKEAKREPSEVDKDLSSVGFCPNCTSTNIRRTIRKGLFEEFLRLFFVAPFRCKACRHKFYRF
jgi:hypothetical protein